MNVSVRLLPISLLLVLLHQAGAPGVASASVTNPKRGDCYLYTNADIDKISATKATVPCSGTHNQETYRVARWNQSLNPFELSDAERGLIAVKLCQPFKGSTRFFNYWNYYLPTEKQWAAGARWVRCDAAVLVSEGPPSLWASWKGLRLDIR